MRYLIVFIMGCIIGGCLIGYIAIAIPFSYLNMINTESIMKDKISEEMDKSNIIYWRDADNFAYVIEMENQDVIVTVEDGNSRFIEQ